MTAKIIRPLTGRIQVHSLRAPQGDEASNKSMFKSAAGAAIRPTWVPAPEGQPGWAGHWTIARTHLTDVAESIAIRDGSVEIEMHYNLTEKCDRRCRGADGDECTCACEGKHHGNAQHAFWVPVGETTLIRSEGRKVVSRVLERDQAKRDRETRLEELVREFTNRQGNQHGQPHA
jgi:hypothetical protein